MMLKIGDVLVCVRPMDGLEYGKSYAIVRTRISTEPVWYHDICVYCKDMPWWFGQTGTSECWTNWFVLEKDWKRNERLKELGI